MLAEFTNLHKTRFWELRHQQGYYFYKEIEICDLTPEYKMAQVRLCADEIDNPIKIPIVFTGESTVQVNMHKNGVLRKRSVHIPRSLCGP
jgi:hypothetical protein